MSTNMAMKRAAKAERRKAIIRQKRKAEFLESSLPERVKRAASTPIQYCLLTERLLENGSGILVLARGATPHHLAAGIFMLDSFSLGVKDVSFRHWDGDECAASMASLGSTIELQAVEPSFARKLLCELTAWARTIGFAPAPNFAVIEGLFGEVTAEACDAAFQFGHEGKPLYIQGLHESPQQAHRRLETVQSYIRATKSAA